MTHTKCFLFFSLYISAATLHNNAVAAAKLAAQTAGSVPTAGKVTLCWHRLQSHTRPGNENRNLLASILILDTLIALKMMIEASPVQFRSI